MNIWINSLLSRRAFKDKAIYCKNRISSFQIKITMTMHLVQSSHAMRIQVHTANRVLLYSKSVFFPRYTKYRIFYRTRNWNRPKNVLSGVWALEDRKNDRIDLGWFEKTWEMYHSIISIFTILPSTMNFSLCSGSIEFFNMPLSFRPWINTNVASVPCGLWRECQLNKWKDPFRLRSVW